MKIVILAERFEGGAWRDWEHTCDQEEVEAVVDSANAKAFDHRHPRPSYIDYLQGAAYIFNVANGPRQNPRDGDTRVYAAVIDEMLIGNFDKVEHHLLLKNGAA